MQGRGLFVVGATLLCIACTDGSELHDGGDSNVPPSGATDAPVVFHPRSSLDASVPDGSLDTPFDASTELDASNAIDASVSIDAGWSGWFDAGSTSSFDAGWSGSLDAGWSGSLDAGWSGSL